MSVITKPGFYRQRNGGKAEVFAFRNGWWYGMTASLKDSVRWNSDGVQSGGSREFCGNITGPLIDEPDPGEGWRLLKEGDVVERGDESYERSGWHPRICFGQAFSDLTTPHRRRIVPPFRISDKGCGVYETRDGREAIVSGKRQQAYCWYGTVDGSDRSWTDSGSFLIEQRPADLVRYLRPLDETWTPTNELRFIRGCFDSECAIPMYSIPESVDGSKRVILQQRWERRTHNTYWSEWRAVPVEGK